MTMEVTVDRDFPLFKQPDCKEMKKYNNKNKITFSNFCMKKLAIKLDELILFTKNIKL